MSIFTRRSSGASRTYRSDMTLLSFMSIFSGRTGGTYRADRTYRAYCAIMSIFARRAGGTSRCTGHSGAGRRSRTARQ